MNCPTIDDLSRYTDELLTESERLHIEKHLQSCSSCQAVVTAFEAEEQFIKDSLQKPGLPVDFTNKVLDQLESYPVQTVKRKKTWRRFVLTAAGAILAIGISAAAYPSFAELIGGIFSTDQVDEGLQMATEEGLTKRVNASVTDQGITLKVEDVVADTSRVSLSYLIVNEKGKPLDAYLNIPDEANKVTVTDQNGNLINDFWGSWRDDSDYGNLEFSLREHEDVEQVLISFDLTKINGKTGNWQLDIPVDLQETGQLTETLVLDSQMAEFSGVEIHMKKWQMAPSSNELKYETMLTAGEQKRIDSQVEKMKGMFNLKEQMTHIDTDTAIAYRIEDESENSIYKMRTLDEQRSGALQSMGQTLDKNGHMSWIDSFIPQKNRSPLTFVLEGVYKAEPADFSFSFQPEKLKDDPVSFEYEGNYLTVHAAEMHKVKEPDKLWNPFSNKKTFKIDMEGESEIGASEFGYWILEDENGDAYPAYPSGGTSNETKNDRHERTIEIDVYGLKSVPEEVTLHLVAVKRYYPTEKDFRIPLYTK